jgi:hypothetical protein
MGFGCLALSVASLLLYLSAASNVSDTVCNSLKDVASALPHALFFPAIKFTLVV